MTKDMEIEYLKTLIRYYQKLIRKLVNNKEFVANIYDLSIDNEDDEYDYDWQIDNNMIY